jgi:hypothetical protein
MESNELGRTFCYPTIETLCLFCSLLIAFSIFTATSDKAIYLGYVKHKYVQGNDASGRLECESKNK